MALNDFAIGGANRLRGAAVDTVVPMPNVGASMQQIGRDVGGLAEMMAEDQDHRDRLRAVELEGQASRQRLEATAELDPTADDYLEQYEERTRAVQQDIMADPGITSSKVLEGLEMSLTKQGQHHLYSGVVTRREAIEKRGLALLSERLDEAVAQIVEDPDGHDAYVAGFAAAADQIGPAVNPAVMAEKLRAAGDAAITAKVEGLALAGRYDEATEFLTAAAGELDADRNRFLARRIREIQTNHKQDFLSATAKDTADIDVAITDANTLEELDEIRAIDIDGNPDLWQGRQQERAARIQELENKRRRIIEGQRDLMTGLANYNSGTGTDDQKQTDLVYDALYPEGASQEQLVEFTRRAGFLPSSAKRIIENAERVDGPDAAEHLARAAQLAARVEGVAPSVDTGAGNRTALTRAFNEIGLPLPEAARLVMDRAPDEATTKARGDQFDQMLKDADVRTPVDTQEYWRGMLEEEGVAPRPWFATDPVVADGLIEEAGRSMRLLYQMSGDFEVAKKAAVKQLMDRYGVTNVGGVARVEKFPAERYLPIGHPDRDGELRTAVLDGLVRRSVAALGVEIPSREDGPMPTLAEARRGVTQRKGVDALTHSLVGDERTEREISQGLAPSYEVRVLSKIGDVMVPVWAETKDGRRVKLRLTMPDAETANNLPEVVEARGKAAEKATFRRDVRALAGAAGTLTGVSQAAGAVGRGAKRAAEGKVAPHPFSGWMQRRRAKRLAEEGK